jgi:hypothetical protein
MSGSLDVAPSGRAGTPTGTPAVPLVAAVAPAPGRLVWVTDGVRSRRVQVLAGAPPARFKLGVIKPPRPKKTRHRVIPNRRKRR